MTPRQQADADARRIVDEVGICEYCRRAPATDPHEILRGSLKGLSRGKRSCTLALCRACHDQMGGKPWEWQLAILWRSRREDFNLLEVWKIAGRRKPTVEEMLEAVSPARSQP